MQQEECVLPALVDTPYAHLLPQVGYPLTCARPDTMILFIHLRIYISPLHRIVSRVYMRSNCGYYVKLCIGGHGSGTRG